MNKLLLIGTLLLSPLAYADSLYTGAWSEHITGNHQENEVGTLDVTNSEHNLLAYEKDSYIVGYFKNSFNNDTIVVGKRFELFELGDFKAGVYTGATYGYYSCRGMADLGADKKVCPAIVPEISYTKYKLQPTLLMLGGAVAISLKWDI